MLIHRIRSKRVVWQVLLLWFFTSVAAAAESCCELIAESIPHHVEQAQPHGHMHADHHQHGSDSEHTSDNNHEQVTQHEHDDHSEHASTNSHGHDAGGHEHCPSLGDINLEALYIGASSHFEKTDPHYIHSTQDAIPNVKSISVVTLSGDPPWIANKRTTYLDTLRIRV